MATRKTPKDVKPNAKATEQAEAVAQGVEQALNRKPNEAERQAADADKARRASEKIAKSLRLAQGGK